MVVDKKTAFARRLNEALSWKNYLVGRGRRARLAKKMGVTGEAARKWLAGESIPAIERGGELALLLHVDVDALLTGRNWESQRQSRHDNIESRSLKTLCKTDS